MGRRNNNKHPLRRAVGVVVAAGALAMGLPVAAAPGAAIFVVGEASGDLDVFDDKGKKIDTGHTSYNVSDGFAVGDVDGDGADELVIAGDVSGDIEIYELGGSTSPVRTFDGNFYLGNGLAVGNVMGDDRHEILVAGIFSGDVEIFDQAGTLLATIAVGMTPFDGFATGNVMGDAYDEIIVAGEAGGDVDIFDAAGNALTTFAGDYTVSDGFAVGDVLGDSYDEILIAGDTWEIVDIFDAAGTKVFYFDSGFTISDGFAVGDVDDDGKAEILIAGEGGGDIDVFEADGTLVRTFAGGFTIADGFAVSQLAWPDADGDGLMDDWEVNGFDADGDGVVDLDLPGWGATPDHKDLFLELDWVIGQEPSRSELAILVDAFANAPVTVGGVANPDGVPGIRLHIDSGTGNSTGEPENVALTWGSCADGIDNDNDGTSDMGDTECAEPGGTCWDGMDNDGDGWIDNDDGDCLEGARSCSDGDDNDVDGLVDGDDPDCLQGRDLGGGNGVSGPVICLDASFYSTKQANFDSARRQIFRYAISGDPADSTCSGGRGELGGNDFIDYNHDAGTLMHELGHNLNLRHGGDDDNNCKPSYVSVMNYDNQFGINRTDGSRILDYSPARRDGVNRRSFLLPTLTENALVETAAVLDAGDSWNMFVFTNGNGDKIRWPLDDQPDYDGDGWILSGNQTVNIDDDNTDGNPQACNNSVMTSALDDHDDWARVSASFRGFGDYLDAANNPVLDDEPSLDELRAHARSLNKADLAVSVADSVDPAVAGETLDVTLEVENLGANPTDAARVDLPIPAGFTLVSAPGCVLLNDGVTLSCPMNMVFPGDTRTFTATLAIAADLVHVAGGPVDVAMMATVTNITGDDPVLVNNAATEMTRVVAVADLALLGVTNAGAPPELLIGETAPVLVTETLASSGPSSPMDATVSRTATAGAGATITVTEPTALVPALETGGTRVVSSAMTVGCALPGVKAFGVTSTVSPARPDDTDPNAANDAASTDLAIECVVPVSIRVMPKVNGARKGVLPVEIRSNEAGEYGLPLAFDATSVNVESVRFGSRAAAWANLAVAAEDHARSHGGEDRVMHFPMQDAGLPDGEPEACVKGTFTATDGNVYKFFGCDTLRWSGN